MGVAREEHGCVTRGTMGVWQERTMGCGKRGPWGVAREDHGVWQERTMGVWQEGPWGVATEDHGCVAREDHGGVAREDHGVWQEGRCGLCVQHNSDRKPHLSISSCLESSSTSSSSLAISSISAWGVEPPSGEEGWVPTAAL